MEQIKKNKVIIIAACFVFLVVVVGAFLCGKYTAGKGLHDNGNTASAVEQQLDAAAAGQHEAEAAVESAEANIDASIAADNRAIEGLDAAAVTAKRIQERNDRISQSIQSSQSGYDEGQRLLADSEHRIAECQGILSEIQKGTGAHGK